MENFFELPLIEISLYNSYFSYSHRNFLLNLFLIVKIIGLIVLIYTNEIDNSPHLSLSELTSVFPESFTSFASSRKLLSMTPPSGTKSSTLVTASTGTLGTADSGSKEVAEFSYKT